MRKTACALLALGFAAAVPAAGAGNRERPPDSAQVIEMAQPGDWRRPDPAHTLYLQLASGRVVIELAPRFAPGHVANIEALVAEKFFDGLAIVRSQENYVVQWGDADQTRKTEYALRKIPGEFTLAWHRSLPFIKLPDADGFARETGWIDGFPVGVERKPSGQVWLTHCYGMVGVGRDNWPDTGSGTELYVVIGHAPRHLDRNIVLVGRVLRGIELLSTLPRGGGALGFYEKAEQRVPLQSMRRAADVPEAERTRLEVLRTDTPLFTKYIESRRNRREGWFVTPAGHTEVCSIHPPVRDVKQDADK
jgi:peptidylprolyl isomerase